MILDANDSNRMKIFGSLIKKFREEGYGIIAVGSSFCGLGCQSLFFDKEKDIEISAPSFSPWNALMEFQESGKFFVSGIPLKHAEPGFSEHSIRRLLNGIFAYLMKRCEYYSFVSNKPMAECVGTIAEEFSEHLRSNKVLSGFFTDSEDVDVENAIRNFFSKNKKNKPEERKCLFPANDFIFEAEHSLRYAVSLLLENVFYKQDVSPDFCVSSWLKYANIAGKMLFLNSRPGYDVENSMVFSSILNTAIEVALNEPRIAQGIVFIIDEPDFELFLPVLPRCVSGGSGYPVVVLGGRNSKWLDNACSSTGKAVSVRQSMKKTYIPDDFDEFSEGFSEMRTARSTIIFEKELSENKD